MVSIINGCTLTRLAMNYSWSGKDDGSGSGEGSGDGVGSGLRGDPPPYCGLPWTVGQRVVKHMDTDGRRTVRPIFPCPSCNTCSIHERFCVHAPQRTVWAVLGVR